MLHPVAGQTRVVFLKPLITRLNIEVGEYTYYDHPEHAVAFERDAVLYGFGPERLVIGRFCALAAGVRFLLPGANHADRGPSTYPFGIFGGAWSSTMDLVTSAPSRGDTVVGHDVWLGYRTLVRGRIGSGLRPNGYALITRSHGAAARERSGSGRPQNHCALIADAGVGAEADPTAATVQQRVERQDRPARQCPVATVSAIS